MISLQHFRGLRILSENVKQFLDETFSGHLLILGGLKMRPESHEQVVDGFGWILGDNTLGGLKWLASLFWDQWF